MRVGIDTFDLHNFSGMILISRGHKYVLNVIIILSPA